MTARSQATTTPGASRASWPMMPTGRACRRGPSPATATSRRARHRVLPSGRRHDGGPVQGPGAASPTRFSPWPRPRASPMTGWTTPRSPRGSRCSASPRGRGPRGTPSAAGSTRAPCGGGGAAGHLPPGHGFCAMSAVGREGAGSLWPRGIDRGARSMSWRQADMRAWTRSCRCAHGSTSMRAPSPLPN
jgi:hypothetical protein